MGRVLEAIYENGVLKPLEKPDLAEGQRVVIELGESTPREAAEYLKLCQSVFAGLSDEDIAEIESIALDRSGFRTRPIDV